MSFYVSFQVSEPFPESVPQEHIDAAVAQNADVERELAALYDVALELIDSGVAGESGGGQVFDLTLSGHKAMSERVVLNLNLQGGGPKPPEPASVPAVEPGEAAAVAVPQDQGEEQNQQAGEEGAAVVPQQDQENQAGQ